MSDSKTGWTTQQYSGAEVKRYADWKASAIEDSRERVWACPKVELLGLQMGDEILVATFTGWALAKVTEIDHVTSRAMAENEGNLFPLRFGQDDRETWICTMGMNKKAIQKIKLEGE